MAGLFYHARYKLNKLFNSKHSLVFSRILVILRCILNPTLNKLLTVELYTLLPGDVIQVQILIRYNFQKNLNLVQLARNSKEIWPIL